MLLAVKLMIGVLFAIGFNFIKRRKERKHIIVFLI
jgi:hypothetical protein